MLWWHMMASNFSFTVLLSILVTAHCDKLQLHHVVENDRNRKGNSTSILGGALLEAAGRPLESWTDTSSLNNHGDDETVTIPSFLHNYMSTLDPAKIQQYAAALEDDTLGQHSSEFCHDAKLICDSNIAIENPNSGNILKDVGEHDELFYDTGNLEDEDQSLSFGERDILKGQDIVFPERFHRSSYSSPSFLPHSLAEKMPFSSEKILELMDILHIAHKSKLATMMSQTVGRCQFTEEKSSKEMTLTKEKEIKEKGSVENKRFGKEIEFGDEKSWKDKEIKDKEFKDEEVGKKGLEVEKTKSSKAKEIKDTRMKKETGWKRDEEIKGKYKEEGKGKEFQDEKFSAEEFEEKEMEKKELEVKKEKSRKEKEIKDKDVNKKEIDRQKDEETKGKYKEGEAYKDEEFNAKEVEEKEMEKKELEVKKEKWSKEREIHKKDMDWNKEDESKGKYGKEKEDNQKELKDNEIQEKEVETKELEVKKEKSSKEKEIKKKEIGWKKDEDIEGKYSKGPGNNKENEIKGKEVGVKKEKSSKEKVLKEKEIEVRKETSSKETLKCVTSLEDMTSFVKKSLPAKQHIKALETSNYNKLVDDHKKAHWKVSEVKKYEKAVVCTKEFFPFAVLRCHAMHKTKGVRFYYIKLEGTDGVHRKEVVACNDENKSQKFQHRKTGTSSQSKVRCHWITNSLIWVPDI